MGFARSFLPLVGGVLLSGGCIYGGYVARVASDYPQTVREVGYGPLLASRGNSVEIAEGDYFREVSDLLKGQYVEPVKDDKKLLAGAVRGMVVSLADQNSMFFAPEEFKVFKSIRQGRYEGIGAWLAFEGGAVPTAPTDEESDGADASDSAVANMPRLTVISVVPGGPAAKAGLRSGDIVEEMDGRWIVNGAPIVAFRKAARDFREKRIDVKEINRLRTELQSKLDRSLMPLKARERLVTGTTGTTKLTVTRGTQTLPLTITKATSEVTDGVQKDGTIALPFVEGAPKRLAEEIAGKSAVTIDLRGNVLGDDATMMRCLEKVAPAGTYGVTVGAKGTKTPFRLAAGNPKPPKISLLVDRSTRGAAQIFALALTNKGLAKIVSGSTAMVPDRDLTLVVQLPEGSGYTLTSGEYRTSADAPAAKTKPATGKKAS
ncbi:hypothetical protein EON77_05930 [bacterium]|nr:MAG: hypothetical protein EON77_05930 [bacterium]